VAGCRDRIVRKLAFAPPPKLPLDDLTANVTEDGKIVRMTRPPSLAFLHEDLVEGEDYVTFTISVKDCMALQKIHGAHIRAKNNKSGICIIFSHGNAADVRTSLPSLYALSEDLQVDLVVYDYPGYGFSSGYPSEEGTYRCIREVYDYLMTEYSGAHLVLYGQSIGSGPSVDLACDAARPVGGLVLHCPIASGLSVVVSEMEGPAPWFDIYRNLEKVSQVKCKVFVLHGTGDTIVPFDHGKQISDRVKAVSPALHYPPWWVKGADHGDLEVRFRAEYLRRLKTFLASVI